MSLHEGLTALVELTQIVRACRESEDPAEHLVRVAFTLSKPGRLLINE
jgi:hypothetical protein